MSKSRKKSEKRKLSKNEPKAKCCKCLQLVPYDEYMENDHYCDACAGRNDFPLASETHFKQWYNGIDDEPV